MPWCPVCRNEYVKGYTRCSDCDVDLVESLEDGPQPLMFGGEAQMKELVEVLSANGVEGAFTRYDEKENVHELLIPKEGIPAAKTIIMEFLRDMQEREAMAAQMAEDDMVMSEAGEVSNADSDADADGEKKKAPDMRKNGAYVDKKAKAEEYKSSAFALLFIGTLGIVMLVLLWMGILPFHMYGMGKLVFTGVMGFLFLVFFVMGINSIKMYKSYVGVASKETSLIDEVNAFLEENLQKEQVDTATRIPENLEADDETQAQLYFVRVGYIKKQLLDNFAELDIPLADKLADDWYSKQYDA